MTSPTTRDKRGRLIAIHDAALAVHNNDIAMIPCFQTEFQLRLLLDPKAAGTKAAPTFANSFP